MKTKIRSLKQYSIIGSLIFIFISCGSSQDETDDKGNTGTNSAAVEEKIDAIADSTQSLAKEMREELSNEFQTKIDNTKTKLRDFKKRLEVEKAETRTAFKKRIDLLEEQQDKLDARIKEFSEATDDVVENIRMEIDTELMELEQKLVDFREELDKSTNQDKNKK